MNLLLAYVQHRRQKCTTEKAFQVISPKTCPAGVQSRNEHHESGKGKIVVN